MHALAEFVNMVNWGNTPIAVMIIVFLGILAWKFLPRLIDSWEKRNDALVTFVHETSDAVKQIPTAIKSFEMALLGVENRVVDKVVDAIDSLRGELHDKKVNEIDRKLADIKRASMPSSSGIESKRGG